MKHQGHSHKTTYFKIEPGTLDLAAIADASDSVRSGGLVVFPTDTVYGLGCLASDKTARQKIFDLKGRPRSKELPVLVASGEAALPLMNGLTHEAEQLMKRFWPGPLTMVVAASPKGKAFADGRDTIALRVPDHPIALALLRAVGAPMAVTSANRSGQPGVSDAEMARKLFSGSVEIILDGGPCPLKRESTVVDVTASPPKILREGMISRDMLMVKG